jgi:hypothetical protein
LDSFLQSNKPIGRLGEARQSGNRLSAAFTPFFSKKAKMVLITAGSSPRRPQAIPAMILTSPSHSLQVSISILKTRFKRFAQVIARDGMYAGFAGAKTGH